MILGVSSVVASLSRSVPSNPEEDVPPWVIGLVGIVVLAFVFFAIRFSLQISRLRKESGSGDDDATGRHD